MHLVAIAWLYVVLMMALVEAMSTNGTWLGAIITLVLYGVAPLSLVLYILATPARRRAHQLRDIQASAAAPDEGRHAPGEPVAPKREET